MWEYLVVTHAIENFDVMCRVKDESTLDFGQNESKEELPLGVEIDGNGMRIITKPVMAFDSVDKSLNEDEFNRRCHEAIAAKLKKERHKCRVCGSTENLVRDVYPDVSFADTCPAHRENYMSDKATRTPLETPEVPTALVTPTFTSMPPIQTQPITTSGYERFTDRARKVMQLANQEAQRFGHDFVSTEHVLIGLVKEGSGVAAQSLKSFSQIDLRNVRKTAEELLPPDQDRVTMGKLPYTDCVNQLIERAKAEAATFNHNYVGTEHLLLAMSEDTRACIIFQRLGASGGLVRGEVNKLLFDNKESQQHANNTTGAGSCIAEPAHQLCQICGNTILDGAIGHDIHKHNLHNNGVRLGTIEGDVANCVCENISSGCKCGGV